ncbi:NAP1-related protein 2 [Morus notabilis]|uniref:NAP1-related protein 2 n=1 Tax=Morus notabilis TaxID=981085 RepID=UPI000CED7E3B|nr:NAP1-related protein 2 [Morus notabilis]
MVVDKGKKKKVSPDEEFDHVDEEFLIAIEKLQELQDDLDKVNEEATDKVLEVEQKYNEIRRPVYVKRNDVIKAIPDFWLTAFLSHPALSDLLSDEDQKIFKYLYSLDVEDFKDIKSGYSITFNFNNNPYFEDAKLSKTFTFSDEGTTKISGTTIKWKEGMAAAFKEVNHEKKGKKQPLVNQSFFSWFSETEQKDIIEFQDEVGEIIKEDLWPNPLKYFNNEPNEEDSVNDHDVGRITYREYGNDDDEQEEDDDDDDYDDDEE